MIAYRCHYEPTNLKAIKLIRDGAVGQVEAIESPFGFNIAPGEWRLNKKLAGGGPVFDVGIYALNACRYLTGEDRRTFRHASTIDHDGRFNEVEENVAWTMKFPSASLPAAPQPTAPTWAAIFASTDRRDGLKSTRPLSTKDCTFVTLRTISRIAFDHVGDVAVVRATFHLAEAHRNPTWIPEAPCRRDIFANTNAV